MRRDSREAIDASVQRTANTKQPAHSTIKVRNWRP